MSLRGVRVVVTRAREKAGSLALRLAEAGAEVIFLPLLGAGPPQDPAPLERSLLDLSRFQFVAFTSASAVDAVMARLGALGEGPKALDPLTVGAVGAATASRLAESGVVVEVLSRGGALALAGALVAAGARDGARVLWPRGDLARDELKRTLEAAGAEVTDPVAYRTVPEDPGSGGAADRVAEGAFDAVAFMSPSAARAWSERYAGATRGSTYAIASVGPTTSTELRALGLEPSVEALEPSAAGLAAALERHFARRRAEEGRA